MATEDRDPCERVDALLAELSGVDGREADLPGGEGDALLRHAAACSRCRRALEGYRRTVELLRALPAVSAPPDLAARVRRGIAAERGRPLAIVRRAVSPLPVSLAAASIFALVAALWILWESRTPRGLHDLARDERAPLDRPAVTESADRDEFAERPGATVAAPAAEVAAEPFEGAELEPVLIAVAVPPSRPIDPGEVDLLRRDLEAQFSHGARGGDGAGAPQFGGAPGGHAPRPAPARARSGVGAGVAGAKRAADREVPAPPTFEFTLEVDAADLDRLKAALAAWAEGREGSPIPPAGAKDAPPRRRIPVRVIVRAAE